MLGAPRTTVVPPRLRVGLGLAAATVTAVVTAVVLPLEVAPAGAAPTDVVPVTVYVSPSGDDAGAGTADAPLRTIGAAVRATPSDGQIIVETGTYHESVTLEGRSGRRLAAAPGADVWLDGSVPVTGWTQQGTTWAVDGWDARFDASPTFTRGAPDGSSPYWRFVDPAYPMAAHPDQVWIDDVAQQQVGSLDDVRPGTFLVDYDAHRLYLGSDPTGHDVRASDLAKALTVRDPGTKISGINVHRYADSVPTLGAVTVEAPDVHLADLSVNDNATTGLGVFRSGAHVARVRLNRNGMHGLLANRADGLRLARVSANYDNAEHFNVAPSAGGAKITRSSDVVVRSSRFTHNLGTGLWFDESVYRFAVLGSLIADNAAHGMSLEISGTGSVINNLITGNADNGIKVNDTDRVRIWNNTLSGNGRSINIVQDGRDLDAGASYRDPSLPLTLRSEHIGVRNNILADTRSTANCLLCVEDYTHRFSAADLHIVADANVYQQPDATRPTWLVVWSRGPGNPAVYTSLEGLRAATGAEMRGRLVARTPALTSDLIQTWAVRRLTSTSAYSTPTWLAEQVGVRRGQYRLGSWRH